MIRRIASIVGLVGLGVAAMLAGDDSSAQQQQQQVLYSTACQTNMGICPIPPSPAFSACRCFNDPGRVVEAPPDWPRTCRTGPNQGCATWAYPAGTACRCGNFPGQVSF